MAKIQSACDRVAAQYVVRQAMRTFSGACCGTAAETGPINTVKPAAPAIPSISRRVISAFSSVVSCVGNESSTLAGDSGCCFAIMVSSFSG
uniref:Uncharacterized protein n=1 Tax=Roseihalotalea indica TaxID=2867963 RepID=A0AA49GIA4_9BACT|nr:hypothetical protein K4G66_22880 [Tunicatimonas sp. TK19036]